VNVKGQRAFVPSWKNGIYQRSMSVLYVFVTVEVAFGLPLSPTKFLECYMYISICFSQVVLADCVYGLSSWVLKLK
jgi:hypothetical protein